MNKEECILRKIKLKNLSEIESNLVLDYHERRFRLINPKDPPQSRDLLKRDLLDEDPYWERSEWYVWNSNRTLVLGYALGISVLPHSPEYDQNKNTLYATFSVDKEYRRFGIGKMLLTRLFEKAVEFDKKSLLTWTVELDGREFAKYLGIGIIAQEGGENRLYMDQVDWNLMQEWNNNGPIDATGAVIESFIDVPERDLETYTAFFTEVLNLVPKGEEEWEANITPEVRRDLEMRMKKKGYIWHTKLTREKNGDISGMTEIQYSPDNSHLANQELTGVSPKYRRRGLGKWLKANMLLFVKDEYPEIKYIVTGNAHENAPMLSINTRMGFKPYLNWTSYKISREEMDQFLG